VSGPAENPVRTTVKPDARDEQGKVRPASKTVVLPGSPDLDHMPEYENSDPQASWCGSSVSSEVSVKSTDALIILSQH
jgi:hypothetical protein